MGNCLPRGAAVGSYDGAMPSPEPASHPPQATGTPTGRARSLPKVLLHEHLDGGLRPATLLQLLRQRGLASPAPDAAGIRRWMAERALAGSLEQYLQGFALTVAAMASPQALERVAFEAVEDAAQDGCVLAELRIAPLLFEAHGLSGDDTVTALLAGLARGSAASGMPSGLIVCAMRHLASDESLRAAQLALRFQHRGIIAFDLAGAERGHPASQHAAALAAVREAGLGLTLHAGVADAGERVLQAARLGATRIGHGVRLIDLLGSAAGASAVAELRERGTHLEVCPTSNIHTGAAASLAAHPIAALWRTGVSLSFHTDNRLISGVSMSQEADHLIAACGLSWADAQQMGLLAAAASFLSQPARAQACARLLAWDSGTAPLRS